MKTWPMDVTCRGRGGGCRDRPWRIWRGSTCRRWKRRCRVAAFHHRHGRTHRRGAWPLPTCITPNRTAVRARPRPRAYGRIQPQRHPLDRAGLCDATHSFSTPGAVIAYHTRIHWDGDAGHLGFVESDRADGAFAQSGHVSMPNLSGHIYLATNESGQRRLIIPGRPTRSGQMFGLLTTLQAGAGSQLVPVACPIAFVPLSQQPDAPMGVIPISDVAFAACRAILHRAIDDDFCRWRR